MIDRITLLADYYSTTPDLVINMDQTGIHIMPKANYTYELKNSADVAIVGADDKRQITCMTCCTAANTLLPFQLIYGGEPNLEGAFPSKHITQKLRAAGFDIRQTKSHWSSVETTIQYIDNVIVPYVEEIIKNKQSKNRNPRNELIPVKAILLVDVWFRDSDFVNYMLENYEHIIKLVYVPAGCTSVAQPCDVILQRPFKHLILLQFSEWIASQVSLQLNSGTKAADIRLDFSLTNLRDLGALWVLKAFNDLNDPFNYKFKEQMMKAWNKIGIMKAFDPVHGLNIYKHYEALGWNWNGTPFIPFRELRSLDDWERKLDDKHIEALSHSDRINDDDEKDYDEIANEINEERFADEMDEQTFQYNMQWDEIKSAGALFESNNNTNSNHMNRNNHNNRNNHDNTTNNKRKTRSAK